MQGRAGDVLNEEPIFQMTQQRNLNSTVSITSNFAQKVIKPVPVK